MKKLSDQAQTAATEAQIIADSLFDYNTGLCKKKVPLNAIQTDAGNLARGFATLYGKIGEKIKNDFCESDR
jgi:hypothetical protein